MQRFTEVPVHVAALTGAKIPAQTRQCSRHVRARVLVSPRGVVTLTLTLTLSGCRGKKTYLHTHQHQLVMDQPFLGANIG